MPDVCLDPITRPFNLSFTPPGSKSLTNRALVMAALADGTCELRNVLFADDTHVMIDSLSRLGFRIDIDRASKTLHVHGTGGRIPRATAELFVGNSGTTARFLTALCTLGVGGYEIDGIARMRERPIGPLMEMLRNLGARLGSTLNDGYPPLRIAAAGLPGGHVQFRAELSSQFLSAVLMSAPYAKHEVCIALDPGQSSWPYIEMTMRLMDEFGILCELSRDPDTGQPRAITVPRGRYRSTQYTIEPDASNASYFLALAAIHPGSTVTLDALGSSSIQGDAAFDTVLKKLGCIVVKTAGSTQVTGPAKLNGIDVDMTAMPDTAQTLAVVALFCAGPTTLRGLHTLRVKETDRVAALQTELTKLGARVELDFDDNMIIHPPATLTSASIETYDDHRMAMSFAVAATRVAGIVIKDAQCVNKTYPSFFDELRASLNAS